MASFAVNSFVLLLLVLVATDQGLGAAKKDCMSALLQSFGLPLRRATAYAQRMAKQKFDERSLQRYGTFPAHLRLHLKRFHINSKDIAMILACVPSESRVKSRSCKKTPCGTYGTCMHSAKSRKTFVCDCKAGYSGDYCQKDVCSPNPCANKGVCYHAAKGFLCDCKKGYLGRTCNITLNECDSSPCQNGGVCVDGVLKYTCTCMSGYKGVNCQTKIRWLDANDFKKLTTMIKRQQAEIKQQEAENQRQQAEIKQQQAEITRLKKKKLYKNQPCVSSHGVINWKQRAINKLNSGTDNGQLVSMTFKKQREDTHLRLTFSSNLRQLYRNRCSQWYFLIDGRHCSNPAPINGRLHHDIPSGTYNDDHRHSTILGVCRGTSAGSIRSGNHHITMNVRGCPEFPQGDAYTGWETTTIMLVEELCPPQ